MLLEYSSQCAEEGAMRTQLHLQNAKLRARIHHLIEQGSLPVMRPERIAAGYGLGKKCDGCGRPITRDQIEYEIDDRRYGVPLELHLECYVLWQLDCAERASDKGATAPGEINKEPKGEAAPTEP
jgi:hypothetical protein